MNKKGFINIFAGIQGIPLVFAGFTALMVIVAQLPPVKQSFVSKKANLVCQAELSGIEPILSDDGLVIETVVDRINKEKGLLNNVTEETKQTCVELVSKLSNAAQIDYIRD